MKTFYKLLLIVFIFSACKPSADKHQEKYNEQYRPQVHFSPEKMWANDPNGMVYYDGEYHLFYQHTPHAVTPDFPKMHWGHAVSTDLIHWKRLPPAIAPDKHGAIFSGSAVADVNNTSGLGTQMNPPLVAIYTYHNRQLEVTGCDTFQYQGLAYSIDKGRNWIKYEHNPVLPNPGIRDFRDPKVSWHPESEKWIMTLAVLDHINFYSSPNLIDWTLESEFGEGIGAHGGVWECPDLFPLQVEGTDEIKWVLLVSINPGGPNGGSATQYFVGEFDGHVFEPHGERTKWLDYGKDNYAGVTWSDIPDEDGRRILLGWMNNWQYANEIPTSGWRGAFTLPRTLELTEIYNDYLLVSSPVKEFEKLKSGSKKISGSTVSGMQEINMKPQFPMEINLNFNTENNTAMNFGERFGIILSNEKNESLKIGYDNLNKLFFIDRSNCGWDSPNQEFAGIHYAPYVVSSPSLDLKLIIDESSVELFAIGGLVSMTEQLFPSEKFTSISLYSEKGDVELLSGTISNLSSIW